MGSAARSGLLVLYDGENDAREFALCKLKEVQADKEAVDGLQRLSKRNAAAASKCLRCSKNAMLAMLEQYSRDISCTGCVRALKASLSYNIPPHGLVNAMFEESADGEEIFIRHEFQGLGIDELGKMFTAFNNNGYFQRTGKGKRRCSLHTAHPQINKDWLKVWDEMPFSVQEAIARFDVDGLSESLASHLKKLYFCRDCRGNVLRALDLLVGYVDHDDFSDDDEYCEESFSPFLLSTEYYHGENEFNQLDQDNRGNGDAGQQEWHIQRGQNDVAVGEALGKLSTLAITAKTKDGDSANTNTAPEQALNVHNDNGLYSEHDHEDDLSVSDYSYAPSATHVSCALEHVAVLVRSAIEADERDEEARINGESTDRHAPTLKDGQNELLHCIGKVLLSRIKDSWTMHLVHAQTNDLMAWLALSCMRTNIQSELLANDGTSALLELLEDEDRKKEAAGKKRNKKKAKKKQKKNKKRAQEEAKLGDNDEKAETVPVAAKLEPLSLPTAALENDFKPATAARAATAATMGGWDEDGEARLLADMKYTNPCARGSSNNNPFCASSPASMTTTSCSNGIQGFDLGKEIANGSSSDEDDEDDEPLTAEEIFEAQKKLERALKTRGTSRAELRAYLREKFDDLCLRKS